MFLKRLESVGFKSFAERINVQFVSGVTAVVGPNGSGKSNITDAIRWVLGEQSVKSLRGSKMEDIIFQGSDTRKKLNVAEVTLVLNNSQHTLPLDFDEISVTRRVYRSGESEFYINKQSCRLKDIIDLFMDSGLGRDAFSIISQGKVEEVLSSKPEDRRTIFEDAAGVLKYKQRKRKAEFKLSETEENLSRVNDIVYEIEQQLDPLLKQAETAKKYLELKDQLKHQEIALLITEIEQLHGEWQAILNEIETDKITEIELKTFLNQKEAELEQLRHKVGQLDSEIEAFQSQLLKVTQELEQYEGKKQLLHERTKHVTENKEKLVEQKQEALRQIDKLTEEWRIQKESLSEIKSKRQDTKERLELLDTKLTKEQDNIGELIEDLKSEYIEHLNHQAAKRNEMQSINQQLQQIKAKQESQNKRVQDLATAKVKLVKQKDFLSHRLSSLKENYSVEESSYHILKQELVTNRRQFEQSKDKLNQGYQMIAKLKSRKEMLEEMKEDFQGFFHGVKSVLKARENKSLSNIHGAVIELIDVPKEYILALETVLGGQAQHIVVSDDRAAREAIYWLKQTNNGRATFLPLGTIEPRRMSRDMISKVKSHPGFIGIAADLVLYDETYKNIIHYLMGNVVVAKTLEDANDIANLLMRRNRIVTLEGDIINPGGSMSGGAVKKTNQSLFSRERDLQDITKKVMEFQKRIEQFTKQTAKQQETIEIIEKDIESKELSMSTGQQDIQNLKSDFRKVDIQIETMNDQLQMYDQDLQQLKVDHDSLHANKKEVKHQISKIEEELIKTQKQIDALTAEETTFKESREQLEIDYHQYQVLLAEQEERLRSQREKTTQIEEQLSEQKNQHEKYTSLLNELESSQSNVENDLTIKDMIEQKKEEKDNLTLTIQTHRSNRLQKNQYIQDQERELKEENKQHQAFLHAMQQNEVKANRLDVELENRLSHLQTEYTITYEQARQSYEKTSNINEAKNAVDVLNQHIRRLGTVNLGAIDEYDRIKTRYDFLVAQKDDLVEAKNMLYSVIDEMDEEMKKSFQSTFSQIKDEFTVVFKELFNGGHAELNLTDPKDLLNTGIDIIAQPPGKKLQNLGLLSGGEKALTAIALLFAILRVRPVPFCIMDEAESALDEANVSRFAKYIKQHSGNTQFIVITHRKGTMEEADVLYGVTMQESGVSRLVSVKLEDSLKLVNT